MSVSAAMVFAAGFGTRMGALTADRPKPLIPVGQRPLLDHALHLIAPGWRTVVNAHYRAEQIANHLDGSRFRISVERPDILDTGGGLKAALPLLEATDGRPVLTLNSDAVWHGPNPLETLNDAWGSDGVDALLLLVPETRAVGRRLPGDFDLDAAGLLRRGGPFVYTGAQIIRTRLVQARTERVFSLNAVWDDLIALGRVRGVLWPGTWCDVGTPAGLELAEDLIRTPLP
ncbi:MAG: nucleotidyltransferase family protein [Pseudomonadota bacterium]